MTPEAEAIPGMIYSLHELNIEDIPYVIPRFSDGSTPGVEREEESDEDDENSK